MSIFCIGRNYVAHAHELGNEVPTSPVIFMKPSTAVLAEGKNFTIPSFTNDLHYEGELVLRVIKEGKNLKTPNVLDYCDAITVGIDFTARDVQNKLKEKGLPWEKAKAFDHSAVIGAFVPKTNFSSLENINFELKSNEKTVQQGNTNLMLWKIDELVAYISQYFTLKKGDIIFTGTPKGVAKVTEGDVLEGFLEDKLMFKTHIK
jgi:2-keto-4-pentenoate hydratase/2-oxohepta-3-ene-1,7-dioic acid hydratase in catechol pathway